MFRQSPNRNQRSKGFKVKHGLQIFLLLAVCIWLLYQVKHSHDKNKEFDESTAELSGKMDNVHDIIKFGRKDLHPRLEEMDTDLENETHVEEDDEIKHEDEDESKHEGGGESKHEEDEEESKHEEDEEESKHEVEEESKHDEDEDESKHEEDEEETKHEEEENGNTHEEEEEIKPGEIEDEKSGGGDDEIDEHDQERSEEEAEGGEDFVDEEGKDREEKEENQVEDVVRSDNQDRDRITQEAREENYKGDDASSAVLRDMKVSTTEADSGISGNPKAEEQLKATEKNKLEVDNRTSSIGKKSSSQDDQNQKVGAGENIAGGKHSVNMTASVETGSDSSQANSSTTEFHEQPRESNMTEMAYSPSSFLQNVTDINRSAAQEQMLVTVTSSKRSDPSLQNHVHNQTEISNTDLGVQQLDFNPTVTDTTENADGVIAGSANSSITSDAVVSEVSGVKSNATGGAEEISGSTAMGDKGGGEFDRQSETIDKAEEMDDRSIPSISNKSADTLRSLPHDSSDTSVLQEEKEAHTDLETLPNTESQGLNNEDAAEE